MGIKFLGVPLNQIDRLCSEEEKVMIEIKTYKTEEIGHPQMDEYRTMKIVKEDVQTFGVGMQIHSWRDMLQFDDEPDTPTQKELSDKTREALK